MMQVVQQNSFCSDNITTTQTFKKMLRSQTIPNCHEIILLVNKCSWSIRLSSSEPVSLASKQFHAVAEYPHPSAMASSFLKVDVVNAI
jgi:hypothetical protein